VETGDSTTGLICAPDGIAADPTSASLFVTTPCAGLNVGYVSRVQPGTTVPVYYGCLGQSILNIPHGITVGPEGTIFVQDMDRIVKVSGVAQAGAGQCATVVSLPGANGIALVGVTDQAGTVQPKYVFITDTSGNIWKQQVLFGTGRMVIASGAVTGTFEVIGPDNCLYASQGTGVTKVTKSDGTCANLGNAGEAVPSISLFWTGPNPVVGTTVHDVTATLHNVSAPLNGSASFTVTFSRIGANPGSTTATGTLQYPAVSLTVPTEYTGTNVGTDTITATVLISGTTYISNPQTITWTPLPDTSAPLIQATVSGFHGDVASNQFGCLVNDGRYLDAQTQYTCGFYTGPPTIHWTVTDPQSGIDASRTFCPDTTVTVPGPAAGTPITCTATNTFGYQSHATVVLNVALTAPTITFTSARYADGDQAAYVAGTYTKRPVTVVFDCNGSYGAPFLSCATPGGTQSVAASSTDGSLPLQTTVTFTAQGTYNPVGTVADQTGRSTTATFGPIYIDTTPPAITGAATVNGTTYLAGTWTNQPVTVTFSCSDAFSGVATCPAAQTLSVEGAGQIATGAGTDKAGNPATGTFGPINLDLSKPVITGATYTTADGKAYVPGTPTNQNVTIAFTCADQTGLSGIRTCPAAITIAATKANEGTQTPGPVTATDNAGNVSDPYQVQGVVIDVTAPTISATGSYASGPNIGTPYGGGWTNQDVTVTFHCTGAVACPALVTLIASTPIGGTPVTGTAYDAAGNAAVSTPVIVRIDKDAPTITGTPDRLPNTYGWYNGPVTVTFSCGDALSGVVSCPAPVTLASDGAALPVSGTVFDTAGNSATFSTTLNIDATVPTIIGAPTTSPNANHWWNTPVTVQFTCSDNVGGAGIDSCSPTTPAFGQGYGQSASGTAIDRAGNQATTTVGAINVDLMAPTLQHSQAGNVVTVTSADDLSGVWTLSYQILDKNGAVLSAQDTAGGATVTVASTMRTFRYTLTDRAENTQQGSFPLTIPTTLEITSSTTVPQNADGTLTFAAKLTETDGGTPLASFLVTISAGGQTQTVGTNAAGVATVRLPLVAGVYGVHAQFDGHEVWLPSAADQSGVIGYGLASGDAMFVIWGGNQPNLAQIVSGYHVQFWGAQWAKQVTAGDYGAHNDFKGWSGHKTATGWSTKPGQTTEPPKTLPAYIGVIVATHTSKDGSADTGNVAEIVVLKVDDPTRYDDNPGHPAFGTVVAIAH